jgi:hypothetical protein
MKMKIMKKGRKRRYSKRGKVKTMRKIKIKY